MTARPCVGGSILITESYRSKEEDDDSEYEELIPPENFAMIEKGLYRSEDLLTVPYPCFMFTTYGCRWIPQKEKLCLLEKMSWSQVNFNACFGGLPISKQRV